MECFVSEETILEQVADTACLVLKVWAINLHQTVTATAIPQSMQMLKQCYL